MDDSEDYKKGIQATFDDIARVYDENRFFAISASRMADLVPSADGLKILDISTGTGAVAIEIARKHQTASIEAIDLSQGMLEIAKSKARVEGIANIAFRQCDVDSMTYGKDSFNVVSCGYSLFFYPDMEATYQAICKITKPGGLFIFSSFTQAAFNPYAERFLTRLEDEYKVAPPSRLRDRLKSQQQIEELITASTFNTLDVIHEPIRYSITIAEWWSLLNSVNFKSLLSELDPQQLERFKQAHLKEIQELSNDATIELNADTFYSLVRL
jgi:ubiquinone/menaquinone biosynthesis C-methylase UbiE